MNRNDVRKYIAPEGWSEEDIPLVRFAEQLQAALDSIPVECRASAVLHIQGYEWCNDLSIQYLAPETDKEMQRRIAEEADSEARRQDAERATYERLRAKFESSQGGVK